MLFGWRLAVGSRPLVETSEKRFIGSKVRASGERVLRELKVLKWLRFLIGDVKPLSSIKVTVGTVTPLAHNVPCKVYGLRFRVSWPLATGYFFLIPNP